MSNLQTKIEVLSKKLEDINSLADKYFEENFKDKEIQIEEEDFIPINIKKYGILKKIKDGYLFFSDSTYKAEMRCEINKIKDIKVKIKILKLLCKNSIS